MILKIVMLSLETKEKPYFVIRSRTNGQFKLACQMQMQSNQRTDALAKSLSTKQAEGEGFNNLHALGEKRVSFKWKQEQAMPVSSSSNDSVDPFSLKQFCLPFCFCVTKVCSNFIC